MITHAVSRQVDCFVGLTRKFLTQRKIRSFGLNIYGTTTEKLFNLNGKWSKRDILKIQQELIHVIKVDERLWPVTQIYC